MVIGDVPEIASGSRANSGDSYARARCRGGTHESAVEYRLHLINWRESLEHEGVYDMDGRDQLAFFKQRISFDVPRAVLHYTKNAQ